MKTDFLIVGHACIDYICNTQDNLESLVLENKSIEDILKIQDFRSYLGGPAGTISNNLSRFKRTIGIVTVLGNDQLSRDYQNFFQKINASVKLYTFDEPSSKCVIINKENEQRIEWFDFVSKHFPEVKPDKTFLKKFKYLILPICEPIVAKRFAEEFEGVVVYNPGQYLDYTPFNEMYFSDIIKKTDILSVNKKEGEIICKNLQLKNLKELFKSNKKLKMIIQTEGKDGSTIFTKNDEHKYRIDKNIKVIDPTGAGDVFLSTFLHYYTKNLHLNLAQKKAASEAAKIVTKEGGFL